MIDTPSATSQRQQGGMHKVENKSILHLKCWHKRQCQLKWNTHITQPFPYHPL